MIDKNKAYRFRGDSERWIHHGEWCLMTLSGQAIGLCCANHLHERGILLEYPELPGEDWEFCERVDAECGWSDDYEHWASLPSVDDISIYCRKKKPVYRSGKVEPGEDLTITSDVGTIYWTTDPKKGKELLS